MRRTRSRKQKSPTASQGGTTTIDVKYGLDPVFEPSADEGQQEANADVQLRSVACPYCGEAFQTLVDLSGGAATYIEDCQICCQPIEFVLEIDPTGALTRLVTRRSD